MTDLDRMLNESAYRREKDLLPNRFPLKQFVAYGRGEIVGDSPDLEKLLEAVQQLGWEPMDVMVIRVGDVIPDYAVIL